MHGGATPMHGGATPMHGGATPMHDGGGDDVWRPGGAIDQTPMHDGGVDADGNDSGWGTSSGQQSDPFSAASSSEGGGWGTSNDQGGSWTPATNDGGSNGFNSTFNQEAYASGGASKDATLEPSIGEGDGGEEAAVWFMERVCVETKVGSKQAVIKDVTGNSAMVEFDDKTNKNVHAGDLNMVAPKEHDMVLVTGGADVGVEGELVCIDGTDAILKDANEEFKIVDYVHLAKIIGDA